MASGFNVRVYGIFREEKNGILVSDEYIKGQAITKFPGGGLEYGEGTRDCLKREWKEELDQDIEVGKHLYTTDFFQISGFGDGGQILSIYYEVETSTPFKVTFQKEPFAFDHWEDQAQVFRWIPFSEFSEDSLTLPIDKIVASLIKPQVEE